MSWGLHRSFAHFGTEANTHMQSWSAVAPDGSRLALTVWHDGLDQFGSFVRYGFARQPDPNGPWVDQYGNRERRTFLEHSLAKLDGVFWPVVLFKTKLNEGRDGKNLYWPVDIKMRLVDVSPLGAFQAITIHPARLGDFQTEAFPPEA